MFRSELPGNPGPGELANADRQAAMIRDAVDQLTHKARQTASDAAGAGRLIRFVHDDLIDVVANAAKSDDDMLSVALCIAGEAVLRLAEIERRQHVQYSWRQGQHVSKRAITTDLAEVERVIAIRRARDPDEDIAAVNRTVTRWRDVGQGLGGGQHG